MSSNVLQSVLADYDSRKEFLEVPIIGSSIRPIDLLGFEELLQNPV